MQIPSLPALSAALLPLTDAVTFDCAHISKDGYKYDLSPLGGVHEISHVATTDNITVETIYVLNICNILKGSAIRGHLKCGTSKNICGFEYTYPTNGSNETSLAFPIVGLDPMGGGAKDPEIARLKELDSEREGLQVKLAGGEYQEKRAGAVIEFVCDPDRSGLEGLGEEGGDQKDGDEDGDGDGDDAKRSLHFKSFGPVDDDSYVLSLNWRTRYACDKYYENRKGSSSHWGFFAWLIVIFFLCAAAYLIFGSWLNYNRYGARGWDLLPHGDTIRDIPYIFQDWLRRVVNTLQGTGSRGGYSAV